MPTKYAHFTLGNYSNPGTLLEPYKTPQKLLDNIGTAGLGFLRGGTYVTTTAFKDPPSGVDNNNRTIIQNYEDEDVVIQRSSGGDNSTALMYLSLGSGAARSYVTITGSPGHPIIFDGNSKRALGGIYSILQVQDSINQLISSILKFDKSINPALTWEH